MVSQWGFLIGARSARCASHYPETRFLIPREGHGGGDHDGQRALVCPGECGELKRKRFTRPGWKTENRGGTGSAQESRMDALALPRGQICGNCPEDPDGRIRWYRPSDLPRNLDRCVLHNLRGTRVEPLRCPNRRTDEQVANASLR